MKTDSKDKNKGIQEKGITAWTTKRLRKSTDKKLELIKASMLVKKGQDISVDEVVSKSADLFIKKYNLN